MNAYGTRDNSWSLKEKHKSFSQKNSSLLKQIFEIVFYNVIREEKSWIQIKVS